MLTRARTRALPARAVEVSPFWGLEKASVLQEARCFNDSQLDARKCQQVRATSSCRAAASGFSPPPSCGNPPRAQVITKLLYLVNQGDSFTKARQACGACPRAHKVLRS